MSSVLNISPSMSKITARTCGGFLVKNEPFDETEVINDDSAVGRSVDWGQIIGSFSIPASDFPNPE